jgi:cardiolipin synthase A/B
MTAPESIPAVPGDPHLPLIAQQALSRTSGAPFIAGNAVRILRDSTENFPAWLAAIAGARRTILFENYIVAKDDVGDEFVATLAAKAREGVQVRLVHDWLGTPFAGKLFRPLIEAGGQVRCFNPPSLGGPLGWLTRDHRKSIVVDGEVAFVSGLCVAQRWTGDAARGVPPWRDTGVEVRGPAIAEVEKAFKQVWDAIGPEPLDQALLTRPQTLAPAGNLTLMVLASEPTRSGVYRLDQFIASMARHTLWLTDAYYIGTPIYLDALRNAARDGVDVRLLVPGTSDLPVTQAFSRAGYRPLLEAGVRVFEWNGSMLHAKTAVADSRWSRVGSSNLNLSSWLANYELDIAVYDQNFGRQMEEMYVRDLENSTEIVLAAHNRVRPVRMDRLPHGNPVRGSASRAAASALRIGNTVSAALTHRRVLGVSEAGVMTKFGAALLVLAALGLLWPIVIVIPAAALAAWVGIALLVRAWKLRRRVAASETPAEREKVGERRA